MNINFLPWRETLHQKLKKRLLIEGFVSLILVFLFVFLSHMKIQSVLAMQEEELRLLEKNNQIISTDYMSALNLQKQAHEESRKEIFLQGEEEKNQKLLNMMMHIAEQMPNNIYLTEIKVNENNLHFLGKSPSHTDLAKFLKNIKTQINRQPVVTETSQVEEQNNEINFDVGYEVLE